MKALVPVVQSYGDTPTSPPVPATSGDPNALLILLLVVGFLALSRGGGSQQWDE